MIAPVQSLAQLRSKAHSDSRYRALVILTANQMGYDPNENLDEAMRQLRVESMETSEDEVLEEVNALRGEV